MTLNYNRNAFVDQDFEDALGSLAALQYLTNMGVAPAAASQSTGVSAATANAFGLNGAEELWPKVGGNAFGTSGFGFGPASSISGPQSTPAFGLGNMFGLGLGQTASNASAAAPSATSAPAAPSSPDAFGMPSSISDTAQAPSSVSQPSTGFSQADIAAMNDPASLGFGSIGVTPGSAAAMGNLGALAAELGIPGMSAPSQGQQGLGAVAANQAAIGLAEAIADAQSNPAANASAQAAMAALAAEAQAPTSEGKSQVGSIFGLGTPFGLSADESPAKGTVDAPSQSQSNLGFGQAPSQTEFGDSMSGKTPATGAEDENDGPSDGQSNGQQGVTADNATTTGPTSDNTTNQALGAIGYGTQGFGTTAPSTAPTAEQQAAIADMFGFSTDESSSISGPTSPPGMSNLGMGPNAFGSDDLGTDDNGPSPTGFGLGTSADAFGTTDGQTSEAPGEQGSIGSIGSSDAFGAESGAAGFGGFGGVSDAGFGGVGGHGGYGGVSDVGVSDNGTDFGGIGDAGYGGYGGGDGYGGPGDGSSGDVGV